MPRALPDDDARTSQALVMAVTTLDDPQAAAALATALVERNLAACCQIVGPIQSIYRWQGKLEQAVEYQVWIKTRRDLWSELEQAIKQLHPYDVPELLLIEVPEASAPYARWLHEQLDAE
jgi:periplasmic divalent cation tolerance protein